LAANHHASLVTSVSQFLQRLLSVQRGVPATGPGKAWMALFYQKNPGAHPLGAGTVRGCNLGRRLHNLGFSHIGCPSRSPVLLSSNFSLLSCSGLHLMAPTNLCPQVLGCSAFILDALAGFTLCLVSSTQRVGDLLVFRSELKPNLAERQDS
jgi:hypothetical protein